MGWYDNEVPDCGGSSFPDDYREPKNYEKDRYISDREYRAQKDQEQVDHIQQVKSNWSFYGNE